MPQSCSLGGSSRKTCLGQAGDSRGAGPCPAQPLLPPQPLSWPGGSVTLSEQWALQEMSFLLQAGAPGPAQAVPVPLHGGWPEGAGFPTTLASAWSTSGATWIQACCQSFETRGFMVSGIMIILGKEMLLLDEEKKLGCNIPCWTGIRGDVINLTFRSSSL